MKKSNQYLQVFFFLMILLFPGSFIFSQDTLPVLTKKDYDQWQILSRTDISPDGQWVVYRITRVEGNDTLFIASAHAAADTTYAFAFGSGVKFSRNSEWAAFRIGYPEKEMEQKKEKHQEIRYKMMLLHLTDGKKQLFRDIRSYDFSHTSGWLAMQAYKPEKSKAKGSDLILRTLKTGTTQNFGNITEWSFNKPGDRLAYIVDAENKSGNSVNLINLAENKITVLASDTNTFRKLSWEKEGHALAFLRAVYDTSFTQPTHHVLAVREISHPENSFEIVPDKISNFPDSMRIKETYAPQWSKDLSLIYFGIEKWTPKKKKDKKKKKKKEKQPEVDIWHWKDDPIQPEQKKKYGMDKNFSYLCSWDPIHNAFHRLADEEVRNNALTGDGGHVLLWTMKPYKPQFKLVYADFYIVDPKTGQRKEILKHHIRNITASPGGKYLLYFKDNNWWTYNITTGGKTNLTESLNVPFWNVRDDHPAVIKPPFGKAGWTNDDREVLLYDEYDVWAVRPDGSKAIKLTRGRERKIIYRYLRTDNEKEYIDTKQPVYFSMFGDTTKNSGFAVLWPKKKKTVATLLYEAKGNSRLKKALKNDKFIFVKQTYEESPDIFYTSADFHHLRKITHTNPQQAKYAWGKATLVSFTNRDGKKLQGVLHYPAHYESGKKYPMLVYIYEIRSTYLHYYVVPSPKSFYNITHYVQQGYFVFQPDIVYKVNHPGESAVNCVVPAVEKIIATGMIDKDRIGIMGHSWGAYQTSFIITQTHLFSAAVAGAPLTDMISMYNSIYWNSGTPDQQIFEVSQGRFTQPWWMELKEYMENSPMFQAAKINTPLLVTFGDKDGAVDWHQGIEMYITMRRMEKPMIMLVYAGENHAVRKKENMLDYTRRINEFFDHYLLGKPAKSWIRNGVKYIDKMKKEEK
ncbi:MAG: S9 family peptidase [Bacteroidales bacterium]|nr:S9 family peptidase [Bacteroidales bacterium]